MTYWAISDLNQTELAEFAGLVAAALGSQLAPGDGHYRSGTRTPVTISAPAQTRSTLTQARRSTPTPSFS